MGPRMAAWLIPVVWARAATGWALASEWRTLAAPTATAARKASIAWITHHRPDLMFRIDIFLIYLPSLSLTIWPVEPGCLRHGLPSVNKPRRAMRMSPLDGARAGARRAHGKGKGLLLI